MESKKRNKWIMHAVIGLILFVLLIIQYSKDNPFNIVNATPMIAVAGTVCAGYIFGELHGTIYGLILGIFIDVVSGGSSCFNTISLFVIGCLAGLLTTCYLNMNIKSFVLIDLLFTAAYFVAKWLIINHRDIVLLKEYYLPSAVYTAVVAFVIYLVSRLIVKKKHLEEYNRQ